MRAEQREREGERAVAADGSHRCHSVSQFCRNRWASSNGLTNTWRVHKAPFMAQVPRTTISQVPLTRNAMVIPPPRILFIIFFSRRNTPTMFISRSFFSVSFVHHIWPELIWRKFFFVAWAYSNKNNSVFFSFIRLHWDWLDEGRKGWKSSFFLCKFTWNGREKKTNQIEQIWM